VEKIQLRREGQADFVHDRGWIAIGNRSFKIIDSRPAGNGVVPRLLEDAPDEFGNRGLLTEGNHGTASAEHAVTVSQEGCQR
jgi:hypothetical protein